MKLRVRSLESRETQRLEVPSSCTHHQLKQFLSQAISSSPSSLLRFSLNRKDELHAPSPETSLQSLGITSGDLIYYSLNPAAFVSVQEHHSQEPQTLGQNQPVANNIQEPNSKEPISKNPEFSPENEEIPVVETLNLEGTGEVQESEEVPMYVDDGSAGRKLSEPFFLRRVLREELGGDASAHKVLAIAVHAVLLESGFVGFDVSSGKRLDRFHVPNLSMSLWYTLPELLNNNSNDSDVTESVVLKLQSLGKFINVYGSLGKGDSGFHRLCLNEHKFAPIIDFLRAKNFDKEDDSGNSYKSEVFEFWKIVKDRLALPLLIDLCERTGLDLPACLMCLPSELKLKILGFLPAVDVMRMECVSTEMRYLASSDEVWKKKFEQEFGGRSDGVSHKWKQKFMWHLEKNKMTMGQKQGYPHIAREVYYPHVRRAPNPFGLPQAIGGDYDRMPGLGIPSPFGQPRLAFPRFSGDYNRLPGRRNFSPNCKLGGI